jgi:hypothetical protein
MKSLDPNILQVFGKRLQHFHSLREAEHRAFFRVPENPHHQLFKNLGASLDQIEMPIGGWIERSWI